MALEEHTALTVEMFDFILWEKDHMEWKSHRNPRIQSLPLLKRFGGRRNKQGLFTFLCRASRNGIRGSEDCSFSVEAFGCKICKTKEENRSFITFSGKDWFALGKGGYSGEEETENREELKEKQHLQPYLCASRRAEPRA